MTEALLFETGELPEEVRERQYQRDIMRKKRAEERDIAIDRSKQDLDRRIACGKDPELFCRTYFKDVFYLDFTADQKIMIAAIAERIHFGGYQAIAAERGGGKSTITKIVGGIWAIVYGYIDWLVLVNANGRSAMDTLKDLKHFYEFNDLLRDDFPEICDPIRALDGAPQRAGFQTHDGRRTRINWGSEEIVMPRIAGSQASGAIITARGVDSAIRGLVRGAKRPRLVIGDDIETRESAGSYTQTASRKETLQKDVIGLAGPGRQLAIVLLCTVINRKCLAWEYTDRKLRPEWQGIRQRWVIQWPADKALWERYLDLRRADKQAGDAYARGAQRFYLENRIAMDAGAQVSNVSRFDAKLLEDGTPLELSSLQSAYNLIGDQGIANFSSEYQNDPPEDEGIEGSGLTDTAIQEALSGLDQGFVPAGTEALTCGIDIGGRVLHWVVVAWTKNFVGRVVDYGVLAVHSPISGKITDSDNQSAVEAAIRNALLEFKDRAAEGWTEENETAPRPLDLCLVDSGWQDKAVYEFIKHAGGKFRASKGFGSGNRVLYRPPAKGGKDRLSGNNWACLFQHTDKVWLYHVNSDFWKLSVQNGFLLPPDKPGAMTLFGSDKYAHKTLARHILAEKWVREFIPGKGVKEYFDVVNKQNHYLDALHYAAAAASILGIQIVQDAAPKTKKVSFAEMQREKREKR